MFRIDSPFMQWMAKLFDLVLLNILFLVCCLPVVTIGASCTALHTMTLKYAAGDEPPVIQGFFTAFKKNFVQATVSWLLYGGVGAFLYVDTALAGRTGAGGPVFRVLLGAVSIVWFVVGLYLFSLQARYRNSIRANYRNAMLLAVMHLPRMVLLALTVLVPAGLLLYGPAEVFLLLGILLLLAGASVLAGVQARVLLPVFHQHETDKIESSGHTD